MNEREVVKLSVNDCINSTINIIGDIESMVCELRSRVIGDTAIQAGVISADAMKTEYNLRTQAREAYDRVQGIYEELQQLLKII